MPDEGAEGVSGGRAEEGWRKGRTIARFVEAVRGVAVRREDRHPVPQGLQPDGGVDDEALRAADAEVRVEEDDISGRLFHRLLHHSCMVRGLQGIDVDAGSS